MLNLEEISLLPNKELIRFGNNKNLNLKANIGYITVIKNINVKIVKPNKYVIDNNFKTITIYEYTRDFSIVFYLPKNKVCFNINLLIFKYYYNFSKSMLIIFSKCAAISIANFCISSLLVSSLSSTDNSSIIKYKATCKNISSFSFKEISAI